jgi:hypothetical protein
MNDASDRTTSACWRLEGAKASLTAGDVSGSLDAARPDLGLHEIRLKGSPRDWRLLNVSVGSREQPPATDSHAWQLVDCYVRGCDFVATYREPLGQHFNLQLYWRVLEATEAAAFTLELIFSVQTRLWEAYPWVSVRSELGAARVTQSDDALVFETDQGSAYVEIPYPGDFGFADPSDSTGPSWHYGPLFMERGVIRRLRLRGAIASHQQTHSCVAAMRSSFLAEQPPLTA